MGLSPQNQSIPDLGLLSVVVLVWGALRYIGDQHQGLLSHSVLAGL